MKVSNLGATLGGWFLLSLLLAAPAVVQANDCEGDEVMHQTDILIIGAGVSAMRAKTRLEEVDPSLKVTLVEANDRVGGRVETVPFAGELIPNGPQWLDPGNAIYDMIVDFGVRIVDDNFFDVAGYEYAQCGIDDDRRLTKENGVADRIRELLKNLESDEPTEAEKVLSKRFLRRLENSESGECTIDKINDEELAAAQQFFFYDTFNCTGEAAYDLCREDVRFDLNAGDDPGVYQTLLACGWDNDDPLAYVWKYVYWNYEYGEIGGGLYGWADTYGPFHVPGDGFFIPGDYQALWTDYAKKNDINPMFNERVEKVKYDHKNGDYRALVYTTSTEGETFGGCGVYEKDEEEEKGKKGDKGKKGEKGGRTLKKKEKHSSEKGAKGKKKKKKHDKDKLKDKKGKKKGKGDDRYCNVYEAKRVISTVAAGVLNEELIEFEPKLRYSAADSLPMKMTNWVKFFFQFEDNFWEDQHYLSLVNTDNSPLNGLGMHWKNLNLPGYYEGSNILLLLVMTENFSDLVGAENDREKLVPKEIWNQLLDPLRIVYGDRGYTEPLRMHHNAWHSNINTGYGALSNWHEGYDPWDYYAFYGNENSTTYYVEAPCEHNGCNGEPEDEDTEWILKLSGSASCFSHWESVWGAWYSGESAADNMLLSLGYTEEEMGEWNDVCYEGLPGGVL